MLKKLKKELYHRLTSGNADIAFYTGTYVAGNKEWIFKRPFKFVWNLIKINLYCLVLHKNYAFKEFVPGRKCIARIHRRSKVYLYAADIMKYPYIITDIFHSLLELSQDMDSIFHKIEEANHLPGFYQLRKKKINSYQTITSIYEEISKELSLPISKDMEISMLKRHLVINPYLKRALEIAAYNHSSMIGILETSYSKEDIEDILSGFSIKLSEIYVSSEQKLPFRRMRNEFMKQHTMEKDKMEEKFAVVSANFGSACKTSARYKFAAYYYRSSKEIMRSIPLPPMSKEFKEVYQTIAGIELFGGQYNHKNLYEITYLYLAPAVYAFLEETYQMALCSNAAVIALCDPECIFAILYSKYFGELNPCIWTGFAGSFPAVKEDWDDLIEDCYIINSYPAGRIASSLGFSFQDHLLKDCREEFIEEARENSRLKAGEAVLRYLKQYLRDNQNLFVVDPMPGKSSLNSFLQCAMEIDSGIKISTLSMSQYLNKDAKELQTLHRILQMDMPYLTGIYEDEIAFVQPNFMDEGKKEIIKQALTDYCHAFSTYQEKNADLILDPSDINAILDHAKEGLFVLEEELGGAIV